MSAPKPSTPVQQGLFLHLDEQYLCLLQALQATDAYRGHSLEAIAASVVYRRALELGVTGKEVAL